jgi:hypothetical protein
MAWKKMQVRGPKARYAYVGKFRVTTLWITWCTLLMMEFKFLSHSLNRFVNEVSPLVTHKNPWETKSSDHLIKQKVC